MNSSPSIKNIALALLKAQKAMGGAVKDSKNPYFKSNYADYGSVLEASKNPLNENGILVLQPHMNRDGKNLVETLLVHAESGEWLLSETEVVCSKQNDPQALGSAITYARRYGLQSLLSMPTADDDGEAAMYRAPKQETKAPAKTPAPVNAGPVIVPAAEAALTSPPAPPTTVTVAQVTETPPAAKKPSFKDRAKPVTPPAAKPVAKANGAANNGGFG